VLKQVMYASIKMEPADLAIANIRDWKCCSTEDPNVAQGDLLYASHGDVIVEFGPVEHSLGLERGFFSIVTSVRVGCSFCIGISSASAYCVAVVLAHLMNDCFCHSK
jgi:hypothetical protein